MSIYKLHSNTFQYLIILNASSIKSIETFRTPEEAEAFLREVQSAKKKQDKPVPPTNLNSSDLNDWYSKQRQFELEQRKRREEAETLLRSYRSTSVFDKNIPVSPKDHVEGRIGVVEEENTISVSSQIGKFEKEGEDEEINDNENAVTDELDNSDVLVDDGDLAEEGKTSMTEENNDDVDDMSSESPEDDVPTNQDLNKVEANLSNNSNDNLDDKKPVEANVNEIEANGDETEPNCDASDDSDDGVKDKGDQDINNDEADESNDVEDVNRNEDILDEIESSRDGNDGDILMNAEEADLNKETTKEVDLDDGSEPRDDEITEQETNAGEIQAETKEADDDLSTNEQSLSMNESVVQEIAVENEKQAEADEDVDSILEAVGEISLDDQEVTDSKTNQSSEEEKKDDSDDDDLKAAVEDGWRFLISRGMSIFL